MSKRRFIDVPSHALLARLQSIATAVKGHGGDAFEWPHTREGREVIFVLRPPKSRAEVRIYTSIAKGEDRARDCGEDAIRIVWGMYRPGNPPTHPEPLFKPLSDSVKVLRTAPKGSPDARLAAFLDRFQGAVREAYRAAHRAPKCPLCSAPMVERQGGRGPFLGCADYPACRGTRECGITARPTREPAHRSLTGHEVVAMHGLPRGEMAREQVEAGLTAEADSGLGFVTYEGGSLLADQLIKRQRRGW